MSFKTCFPLFAPSMNFKKYFCCKIFFLFFIFYSKGKGKILKKWCGIWAFDKILKFLTKPFYRIFRRKLIYEKNTNIKNPVEINLLYSQSRDGILEGVYPCPMEDAAKVFNIIYSCPCSVATLFDNYNRLILITWL